jgi:hypothetical protein
MLKQQVISRTNRMEPVKGSSGSSPGYCIFNSIGHSKLTSSFRSRCHEMAFHKTLKSLLRSVAVLASSGCRLLPDKQPSAHDMRLQHQYQPASFPRLHRSPREVVMCSTIHGIVEIRILGGYCLVSQDCIFRKIVRNHLNNGTSIELVARRQNRS